MADAQDRPAPLGHRPLQRTVFAHRIRDVHDPIPGNICGRVLLRVGVRPLQVAERPSRLGLPAVFPGCRIQFERPERHVVFVFDRNTVPGGCAAVGTGERDRGIILRIGRGHRTVHDSRGMPVRGYGFDAEGDARLVTAGMVDAVHARQFDGADRDCLGERDLDPHGFAVAARRQVHRAAVRTGEHLLPRQVAVPFGREGLQEIAGIVQRRGKGQHSNVAVIAPCLPPRLRKGQHHAPVPCRGIRAAPGQMAHRIRRFDPRAARGRPSRAVLHRKAQPQPVRLFCGMLHHVVPHRAQRRDLGFDARPRAAELPVEQLHARNPRSGNRLEVFGNSLGRYIAADEMEPRLGIVDPGRRPEIGNIVSPEGTAQLFRIGHGRHLAKGRAGGHDGEQ